MANNLKTKTKSDVLTVEEDRLKQDRPEPLNYTQEQMERLKVATKRAQNAKQQRDKKREEFDDMSYEEDYYSNKQAANAYLRPKINDDEVRIVTGTTEKKLEVLANELLSMNLQPEVSAYDDQDNELKNLGKDMMDVVKRTGDMEREEDFWQDYLRELLTQRMAYFQDAVEEQSFPGGKHVRIRKKLISGLRVYLGNINLPARDFNDQPYIVLYSRMRYSEAYPIYKNWENWNKVKAGGSTSSEYTPFGYRMNDIGEDEIEILQVLDPFNNEYEVIINSVLMFTSPTKLPYTVLPWRRYNIVATNIKSTDTDLAYGKPPVASAKTLQALDDEMIRNSVRKWRQALEPPLGVKKSGQIYSKDIWEAGAVTQGVSADDFSILNPDNKGLTQSEFAMIDFINKKTEEFIGAGALQQGVAESGEQTATEVQTLQKNAIKNLGHIVHAFMRAKRDAPYQRIYTVLENFSKPTKQYFNPFTQKVEGVFKRFTINDATFPDGKRGKKIVQFTDNKLSRDQLGQTLAFEQRETRLGRPTVIRFINVKKLNNIRAFWHVVVNSQQREGSALSKVMFKDMLQQAVGISQVTGKPINGDKVTDEFEQRWQVKDIFQEAPPEQENKPNEEQDDLLKEIDNFERTSTGSQMTEGVRGQTQRPGINELNREAA